ncbi:type IV secretion protein [Brucella phage BiPBO1]|uniref:type VI secretion system-associated protein TagO n=1 Tax=Brucella phage BiPBO1 TaxID=1718278 RepID=UPI00046D540D|nr:type VI secretion system-associated protein TagO [Brucella inopinata]YP_009304095.1 type VI secretion system-associated protein TagO [Brucella phage BiPBO1]ALJ98281.1 type IV secretion protein [Brucella phage BiPBO1]KEY04128.1 hypothetical protein IL59_0212025 [Brucella suis bv. 4 str. 40]
MRGLIAVGIVLVMTSAGSAQSKPEECAAIGDSLQRLTCFDKIFPKAETTKTTEEKDSAHLGNWDVDEERSPIDDSPRVTASLMPKGTTRETFRRDTPMLALRCYDNATTVIYLHGKFSTNDMPSVSYRIGSSSPVTERWSRSDNYQSVGLWRGNKAIPFMKSLKNGETLAFKTDDPRTEAVFELGNVETVVDKISKACNWK